MLLLLGPVAGAQSQEPQVYLPETSYHFDITGISEPVEHIFVFTNNTAEILETARIGVTPPLTVSNISARVFPWQGGMLRFRLGDPRPAGDYQGVIEVDFKNPGISNITFEVTGKITPLVEAKPFPEFFVATSRAHPKEASIQIVNHDAQPLVITSIDCSSTRFSLHLQTNKVGQLYTLFLDLPGQGSTGRMAEPITLHTSNQKEPALLIGANTYIYERVHSFPDDLDFGTLDSPMVKTNEAYRKTLTQILMVYQEGGTNFEVTAKTDLPFLRTHAERSSNGKQVQIEVALKPEELRRGDFQGHLELVTNDREFPRMEIVVKGQVR